MDKHKVYHFCYGCETNTWQLLLLGKGYVCIRCGAIR